MTKPKAGHDSAGRIDLINELCQALFETATEGLVLVDTEGGIRLANPRMEALFGYTPDELIGKPVELLVPEGMRGKHHAHRKSYQAHPAPRAMGIGMDLLARRKDGEVFPVEISLNALEVEGNSYVMALITDISMRKTAEKDLELLNAELEHRVQERTRKLRESQLLYNMIARNFPNGTINVFDRQLNYVFVEGKELYRMGVTSEVLTGTNYLERLEPDVRETISENLMPVFEGEHRIFEVDVRGYQYELNATPLPGPDGRIDQILVVEHNITRQKKAEDDIRKTLAKERELNELKSRFVSMASHEFRTPLSTILTSISLVEKYMGPKHEDRRKKHLDRIRTSVRNLTGILNDFLSLDKLETGHVQCRPEPFDLQELTNDLIEEMEAMGEAGRRIRLSWKGETEVRQDPNMLRNIMLNLLSNAVKYSPKDSTVDLRVKVTVGKVRIEIEDRGIGIPEADKPYMFGRFFRASNATNIQGTGLGLNIVKKYLDLMDGSIDFESRAGEGTTFFIDLPKNLSA